MEKEIEISNVRTKIFVNKSTYVIANVPVTSYILTVMRVNNKTSNDTEIIKTEMDKTTFENLIAMLVEVK